MRVGQAGFGSFCFWLHQLAARVLHTMGYTGTRVKWMAASSLSYRTAPNPGITSGLQTQGGAASGGFGPRYWFLLATNGDCRSVLERVNAILGLTGQPFNHSGGLTNGPFYHPVANAPPPSSSTATNVDPVTGLPWGNRVVDPSTGLPLPLPLNQDKK